MANKPRGLGYKARQILSDADDELARAEKANEPILNGEVMERMVSQMLAGRMAVRIANVRRMIAQVLALRGDGTKLDEAMSEALDR